MAGPIKSKTIRKKPSGNLPMEDTSGSSRHEDAGIAFEARGLELLRSNSNHAADNNNSHPSGVMAGSPSSAPVLQPPPPQQMPSEKKNFRLYLYRLLQTGFANLRSQWKILAAGQVLSFLTASMGAVQSTLSFDCHLSAPSLTLGLCYATMSMILVYLTYQEHYKTSGLSSLPPLMTLTSATATMSMSTSSSSSSQQTPGEDALEGSTLKTPSSAPFRFLGVVPLQASPWSYLPMALFDVYANYFTVLAFKYTTITSVTLFDALAIPSAMILSHVFLHRQYSQVHLLAVGCCIVGILINVFEDYEDDQQAGTMTTTSGIALGDIYPHRTFGDVLAITGGLLFGATNTYGEYAVRHLGGPLEYIGMLSFFGAIICFIQTMVIERDSIAAFYKTDEEGECSSTEAQWLLVLFVIATVTTYNGSALFLQVSDAAFFNLSLLTGDLWSVIFSIVEEGIVPGALFFVALVFIVAGVIVYEMTEEPADGRAVPVVPVGGGPTLRQRKDSREYELTDMRTSLMGSTEALLP